MNTLGEYLEALRQRHPRLSMREMALEAGLSQSIVNKLVKGHREGARPETLKALADRWGTPEDYLTMMQLAGHPISKSKPEVEPKTELQRQLLEEFDQLTEHDQLRIIAIARALKQSEGGMETEQDETPAAVQGAQAPA